MAIQPQNSVILQATQTTTASFTDGTGSNDGGLNSTIAVSASGVVTCDQIARMQDGDAIMIKERFPFVVVAGCTICLAGISATSFLLYILTRKALHSNNGIYLAALSLFDIAIMINYILLIAVGIMKDYFHAYILHYLYHTYLPPLFTLGRITQTSQVFLILAATVERYLIVHRNSPYSLKRRTGSALGCSHGFRIISIAMLVFCAVSIRVSSYWEVAVRHSNCTGFQAIYFGIGDILQNTYYIPYNLYIGPVLHTFAPFLTLLILNVLIMYRMRRASVWARTRLVVRNSITTSQHGNRQCRALAVRRALDKRILKDATNTMIAIVTGYLISNTLNIIIAIMEQTKMDWLRQHVELYTLAADVSSFLVVFTSATRLPIYYWCNQKIREHIDRVCSGGNTCHNGSSISAIRSHSAPFSLSTPDEEVVLLKVLSSSTQLQPSAAPTAKMLTISSNSLPTTNNSFFTKTDFLFANGSPGTPKQLYSYNTEENGTNRHMARISPPKDSRFGYEVFV